MKELVDRLKNSEVVCFKTDTVYGLSCNPFSDEAVKTVFDLKQRNTNSPLILLISRNYDYKNIVKSNPLAEKLINRFWPGPLTIIFESKVKFAKGVVYNGKVSLRMPNDEFCQSLLSQVDFPLTSTSANISGKENPNNFKALKMLFPSVFVVDGGKVSKDCPSSIVDVSDNSLKIIREGKIGKQELIDAVNEKDDWWRWCYIIKTILFKQRIVV